VMVCACAGAALRSAAVSRMARRRGMRNESAPDVAK
jgi:hypothetical protein